MNGRIAVLGVALLGLAGAAYGVGAAGRGDAAAVTHDIELPRGYRDWTLISVASIGIPQNDLRAKLGNPTAIRAYRGGQRPFPDGTVIARLAWQRVTSDVNDQAFRAAAQSQLGPDTTERMILESFVAGPPTNVQIMIKDARTYAATGGWGFAQFTNGQLDAEAAPEDCFSCHQAARDRDFVFTEYAP